jgi:acyl carrier protein|tara:strand:+ start:100 stop:348 length:249 start_codon:yes stop_codon:yes gene_type:complete
MKNKKEILTKIKPIFFKIFNNKKVNINLKSSAATIKNWDSLAQISIILNVEKMFKIKFKVSEIADLKNVEDMISLILKKKKK